MDLLNIQGLADGSLSMMSLAAESLSFSFFSSSPLLRATETSIIMFFQLLPPVKCHGDFLEVAGLLLEALLSGLLGLNCSCCWGCHQRHLGGVWRPVVD